MTERWKRVLASRLLGVPAGFEASSEMRVRSPRGVLTPWRDRDGYWTVRMGRHNVPVHVAVCLAFKGRPEVRHLNGDQDDNRPGNLAWGSHWENEQDKKRQADWKREEEWEPPEPSRTNGTGGLPR